MYETKSDEINSFGESKLPQIWRNPQDGLFYASYKAPKNGFTDAGAWAIYDPSVAINHIKVAKEQTGELVESAFLDNEFAQTAQRYYDAVTGSDSRVRTAALRASTNSAVDIVNVWTQVLGKKDRTYFAKGLTKEIPIPNLLISIDTATKFHGMARIDEGQFGGGVLKELRYTRANFTAKKYGLKFVIHEEARLRNNNNLVEDSVQVASTKIEQRQSFSVVAALSGLTTFASAGVWDTFGTFHSTNNPMLDIGRAQLTIEKTNIGGQFNAIGLHPFTWQKLSANTFMRGTGTEDGVTYDFQPGRKTIEAINGIKLVLDPSIPQANCYCVDSSVEPSIGFFQGPQRMGSVHDEESGDEKYFIVDYHNAAVIQSETGRAVTGVVTATTWT